MANADLQIITDPFSKGFVPAYYKAIPIHGYYVYVIMENGKVCYVGKGKKKRVLSHFKGTGNVFLYSRIKDGQNIYDWAVLEHFEDEADAFDYEKRLIKKCVRLRIKLYNSTHYAARASKMILFKGIFGLFKDYENRVFSDQICDILSVSELADIVVKLIKDTCDGLSQDRIPVYRSKPINQLQYFIRPEYGKNRIVFY